MTLPSADPLRLTFVSHSLLPEESPLANIGGMQRHATELHAALARHPEVELTSLVLRGSSRQMHLRSAPFLTGLLWRLPRLVQARGTEAILFSSMVPGLLAIPLGRRLRALGVVLGTIPLGLDVTLPNRLYQHLVRHGLRGVDLLLPISRATAGACAARGVAPARMEVVPCGVEPARFASPTDRTTARRDLDARVGPLPPGNFLLCSVGRHVPRKGFEWFVRSVMPRLPEHVHYWLIGDGPETPRIRRAIAETCLEPRVRLLGRTTEETLRAVYGGADLFVMPNLPVPGDIEGFGIVMIEAGASGLPVIASRLDGIPDVVEEGGNGHLLPPGDAEAFAERILHYDRARHELVEAAGRARQLVAARFAWERVADRYVHLLRGAARQLRATQAA